MSLRDLQADFVRRLGDGTTPPWVRPEPPAAAQARFDVYRRSHANRLFDVLADDFPRVRAVIGEDRFDQLVQAYLRAHPPRDPALRDLGRALPGFLGTVDLAGEAGLARDLARLEWAWVEVFDAKDEPPLQRAELARVPPEAWGDLRLQLAAAVRIERFDHRVDLFDPDDPAERPDRVPTELLIWRKGHRVFLRPLPDLEASALRAVRAGAPFSEVCAAAAPAASSTDQAAERVVGDLSQWLADELIVGFSLQDDLQTAQSSG